MRLFKRFILVPVLGGLAACATVPETGRSQLLLITPAQEMQLGLDEWHKLKQSTPVSRDPELTSMLNRVGRSIAEVAPLPGAQWEFVLFDDPRIANAFALPGGRVGVYTGLLPITQDEAGLATVVGHEIAHAVARHGAERISQGLLLQLGGQALESALLSNAELTRNIVLAAYGIGGELAITLPYSREQELEADRLGLIYMARAGYDPRAAIAFWRRFAEDKSRQGDPMLSLLSTHPVDEVRIQQLEALLPQAMAEYQRAAR